MVKKIIFGLLLLSLIVLSGCNQDTIETTASTTTTNQKSYGWIDPDIETYQIESIYDSCEESDFDDGGMCEIEIEIELEEYGEPTLKYKEKYNVERTGFKTRNNYSYHQELRYRNITEDNVSYNLIPYNATIKTNNPYQQPIYKIHYPHYLTIDTYEYDYSRYNGRVCGKYLLQVSKKDGGTGFEYTSSDKLCKDGYPIIHKGWNCYKITDLEFNIIVESKRERHCEI